MELLKHMRPLLAAVAILTLISGCGRRYRLSEEALQAAYPHVYARGDIAATGAVSENGFDGHLETVWKRKISDKPTGPITLNYGALALPGASPKLRFFDMATGKYLGGRRTNTPAHSAISFSGPRAYYCTAPRRSRLYCYDFREKRQVWRLSFSDGCLATILVNERLVATDAGGALIALDPMTGSELWRTETDSRFGVPAVSDGHKVYQPGDDGSLYAIDAADGSLAFTAELGEPPVGAAVHDDRLVAAGMFGTVAVVDAAGGALLWKRNLTSRLWAAPAVCDGNVIMVGGHGDLVCCDLTTGAELWRRDLGQAVRAPATIVGNIVVVATLTGRVLACDLRNGETIDETQLEGPVHYPPVSDGRRVYVATQKGRVFCLGTDHERDQLEP